MTEDPKNINKRRIYKMPSSKASIKDVILFKFCAGLDELKVWGVIDVRGWVRWWLNRYVKGSVGGWATYHVISWVS